MKEIQKDQSISNDLDWALLSPLCCLSDIMLLLKVLDHVGYRNRNQR